MNLLLIRVHQIVFLKSRFRENDIHVFSVYVNNGKGNIIKTDEKKP